MQRIALGDPLTLATAARILGAGGVAVLPTDTLYGLSAALSSRKGFERIAAIKGYASGRRFVYLAGSIGMVSRYIDDWGSTTETVLGEVWPARLTAILKAGARVPDWVGQTIAMRVPDVARLRDIIEGTGEPILSTSVNRAGDAPLSSVEAIERGFAGEVDLIVDAETRSGALPSTIVDFTTDTPRVVRHGAYDWPTAENPSN